MSTTKSDVRKYPDFFFAAIIASAFFLTAIYLQPFGFFLSIFSPLPIIFIYLQKGQRAGLHTLITVTFLICLIGDLRYGIIYFLEYGIMAMIISETIKKHYPVEKIIILSVLISLLAGGIILSVYFILEGINPHFLLSEQIHNSLDQTISRYKEIGMSKENIAAIQEYSGKIAETFINSFPAWIVVSSIFGALVNYILTKFIWLKYRGNSYFNSVPLSCWQSPDYFIWLFIGAGLMMFAPIDILKNIGLNVLIIMLLLYFLQGLAIVNFYLIKFNKISLFLKIIIYILIMTQFVLMILVLGIGVFDLWVDFRKLNKEEQK